MRNINLAISIILSTLILCATLLYIHMTDDKYLDISSSSSVKRFNVRTGDVEMFLEEKGWQSLNEADRKIKKIP